MSLRELRVLVTHLPPDSATARAHRGHNWGDLEYMTAEILDVVKYHRIEWAYAHGAKPPAPRPTPRPDPAEHRTDAHAPSDRDLAHAAHLHVLEQIMPGGG